MNTERPASPHAAPSAQESRAAAGGLAAGTVFAGRYRIVRHLAAGAMGSVYEVVHVETERRRALKVMHPHLFQSDEMRERFKREARIAAQVESEYIVDVSDAGVDEASQTPFMVMELLQGEELGDRLKRLGPLPSAEVVTYLHQLAIALDKTHAKSIVHRDLKPANVFLTVREDGSPRVKILDFGVAKLVAEGATGAEATRSLGTPLYMAPEQFRTGSKLMPAADIHALGMMAYTLLVGDPYWGPEARSAGDVIAFAMTAMRGPSESAVGRAAARGVMLPPAFDGWFARVTAVDPADRFPKASEAARVLGEVFAVTMGAGSAARPLPAPPAGVMSTAPMPAFATPAPGMTVPAMPADATMEPPTHPMMERASTSTGAAVGSVLAQPPANRAPLIAAATVLVVSALGVGGWLALRGRGGDGPDDAAAAGPVIAASAAPDPSGAPAAPAPTQTASTEPPSVTATTTARPAATDTRPALSGVLATGKPTAQPVATTQKVATTKPATTEPPVATTKPATTEPSLFGRDN